MAPPVNHQLVWTEPAVCDLERIDRYLRRRNPAAARRLGEGLLARVEFLRANPELGRPYTRDLPFRVLPHRGYQIFYRILPAERRIEICHVRHGARDNPTLDVLLTE
jgi:toxin ParE1/3/4